jgi:hypothetical protein
MEREKENGEGGEEEKRGRESCLPLALSLATPAGELSLSEVKFSRNSPIWQIPEKSSGIIVVGAAQIVNG